MAELLISSSTFFRCPCVRSCECGCIHEDSRLPIPPGGFNFSVDGVRWSTCGCLAVFPRLKGRAKFVSILPLGVFDGIDYKSLRSTYSTIIPELGDWRELGFLMSFLLTQSGFFKLLTCRTTADQACFCRSLYLATLPVSKQSNSEIFELSKVQLCNTIFSTKSDATPALPG